MATVNSTSIDKSKLISFINKYYLGGNTDSAKLVIEDNQLYTKFISADQNVIGDVKIHDFQAPDGELGVYTTSQLIKLLSALDEKIEVVFNDTNKKIYSINLKDSNTNVTYMLADLSVIRQVPNLKSLPDFEVQIELNKDFANNFKKAANALPESDNFGIESDGTDTRVIINYSKINTNRIVFNATTKATSQIDTVCFSAKLFKEILTANSDSVGILEVSSKGLARVTFSNSDYTAIYYLVKLTVS
jgi:hypothetical protein